MANAVHDQNHVPTLIAASNADGTTPVKVYADPVTHRLLVDTGGGSSGITSINTDTTAAQTLAVGTTGTDFAIVDNGTGTHTFNLPSASATARGVVTTGSQTIAGAKTFSGAITASNLSGTNTGDQNLFSNIPVSGQTTVTASSATTALTLVAGTGMTITTDNTAKSVTFTGTAGTVTAVSVASSNGFAGTSSGGATPALTLSTTVTGVVKGNGTALSAAGAGSDYVAPGTITTSGLTMNTAKMLGRATASAGAIEEIAVTGSGSAVLATTPTITTPKVITNISDTNGNELFKVTATASAVNEITVANAATGTAPSLTASGDDSNVDITIAPKGTGAINLGLYPQKMTVPTTDGTAAGPVTNSFNSGYTSTAVGDLVYLDSSATWQKTDANASSTYLGLLGIALEVKASASAVMVALPGSFVYLSGYTFTVGGTIYMSETTGAMTQTQPTTADAAIRVVGYAVHANKLYFDPSPDYITHV